VTHLTGLLPLIFFLQLPSWVVNDNMVDSLASYTKGEMGPITGRDPREELFSVDLRQINPPQPLLHNLHACSFCFFSFRPFFALSLLFCTAGTPERMPSSPLLNFCVFFGLNEKGPEREN
jgi:hypothetical protein